MADPKIRHFQVDLRLRPGLGFRGKRNYSLPLESNSSTGYSWTERERSVPSIVDVTHHYVQLPGPPGTGGMDKWEFTALASGKEIIKLAYAPEHDPDDVREWVVISVNVQ